jgi:hypothetical protein
LAQNEGLAWLATKPGYDGGVISPEGKVLFTPGLDRVRIV